MVDIVSIVESNNKVYGIPRHRFVTSIRFDDALVVITDAEKRLSNAGTSGSRGMPPKPITGTKRPISPPSWTAGTNNTTTTTTHTQSKSLMSIGAAASTEILDNALFVPRGLPNVGNSCYLNAMLQVLASLRVLGSSIYNNVDVWRQLAIHPRARELIRLISQQLTDMRMPKDAILQYKQYRRHIEQPRLTKIGNLFANEVFQEPAGNMQDSTEVLTRIISMASEIMPEFTKVMDFGMVKRNDADEDHSVTKSALMLLSIPEYATKRKNKPHNITDLDYMLRTMFPEKQFNDVTKETVLLFPLLKASRWKRYFRTKGHRVFAFGTNCLIGITFNWMEGLGQEASLSSPVSFPYMLGPDTMIGNDDSHDPVSINPAANSHNMYVIRSFIVHKSMHYVAYVRRRDRWYRLSDGDCKEVEVDLPSGQLAQEDRDGSSRVTAVFYEGYQTGLTEGFYNSSNVYVDRVESGYKCPYHGCDNREH